MVFVNSSILEAPNLRDVSGTPKREDVIEQYKICLKHNNPMSLLKRHLGLFLWVILIKLSRQKSNLRLLVLYPTELRAHISFI